MKILFNGKLKAIRTGEYVVADSGADEFILDSDQEVTLSNQQLIDIAGANKIKGVAKKNKKDLNVEKLVEGIEGLKLPSMNNKPDSEVVREIVEAGIEAGTDDDDMVMEIIGAGVKYKVAHKLFEAALAAGGFRLSVKDRKAKVREILLEKEFSPTTAAEVDEVVAELIVEIPDTNSEQAIKCVRAYCREFEIEMPKAAKAPKGGFKSVIFGWIKENPTATTEELSEFIVDEKEKDEKYVDKYSDILKLVRETVESLYEEDSEEEEEETED